jgi:hypothetical protein
VPLAQLHPGQRTGADRPCGSGETVFGHRLDEDVGPSSRILSRGGEAGRIPRFQAGESLPGEGGDRLRSPGLGEEAQGVAGQALVVGPEGAVAAVGQDVGPGRSAATASAFGTGFVLFDGALLGERVQVAPHGGGSQVQQPPNLRRGDRAVLGHGSQDAFARPLLVGRSRLPEKHHTIVT